MKKLRIIPLFSALLLLLCSCSRSGYYADVSLNNQNYDFSVSLRYHSLQDHLLTEDDIGLLSSYGFKVDLSNTNPNGNATISKSDCKPEEKLIEGLDSKYLMEIFSVFEAIRFENNRISLNFVTGQMRSYLIDNNMDAIFTVSFPGKCKSSNATTVIDNGKTLQWDLSSVSVKTIEFEFDSSYQPWIFWFTGLGMLVSAAVFFVVYRSKIFKVTPQKEKEPSSVDEDLIHLPAGETVYGKLRELKESYDNGTVSEEEFIQKKQELLK